MTVIEFRGDVIVKQGTLTLGVPSSVAGVLKISDPGSQFSTIIKTGTQGVDVCYTLPTSDGNNTQSLQTDGNGVLSWGDQVGTSGMNVCMTNIDATNAVNQNLNMNSNNVCCVCGIRFYDNYSFIDNNTNVNQLTFQDCTGCYLLSCLASGGCSVCPGGSTCDIQWNNGLNGFAGCCYFTYDCGSNAVCHKGVTFFKNEATNGSCSQIIGIADCLSVFDFRVWSNSCCDTCRSEIRFDWQNSRLEIIPQTCWMTYLWDINCNPHNLCLGTIQGCGCAYFCCDICSATYLCTPGTVCANCSNICYYSVASNAGISCAGLPISLTVCNGIIVGMST